MNEITDPEELANIAARERNILNAAVVAKNDAEKQTIPPVIDGSIITSGHPTAIVSGAGAFTIAPTIPEPQQQSNQPQPAEKLSWLQKKLTRN